jgi:predicted GH43/DUF377 family glycosyl hydrolase
MKWRKLGRVYVANGKYEWAQTHAYIPTPLILNDRRIRVYVAFLDKEMVGRIGFVDLDINNPLKVLKISKQPVLDIGKPGTFDDSGVTPMSLVDNNSTKLMYYTGWQRGVNVRYFLFTGLAIGAGEDDSFEKHSQAPILDRSDDELFVRTAAHVIKDGDIYKMWYIAGSAWINVSGKEVPTYNMRYLESKDGFSWGKRGNVCLELSHEDEFGFGRPWIIRENGIYKMWYSIRTKSKGYRVGYAESLDGLNWERKDSEAGIDVSDSGWDSEMIGMTSIVDIKGKRYMFYNGNNYGETGFGVAVLEG